MATAGTAPGAPPQGRLQRIKAWLRYLPERLVRWLTCAYLLRVPFLTLGFLATSPILMLWCFPSLLENMVLELNATDLFAVSLLSFLTAATAIATINLTLLHGDERFDDPKVNMRRFYGKPVWLLGATAIPLVAAAGIHAEGHWALHTLAALGGFVAAVVLVLGANALQLAGARSSASGLGPFLVIPVSRIPWLHGWMLALYRVASPLGWRPLSALVGWVTRQLLRLPRWIGAGYFQYAPAGAPLRVYPGHAFATWLFVASLACYVYAGRAKGQHLGEPAGFPTLAFVLMLPLLACWVLGFLAFFFDRYRIPVLVSFLALCALTAFLPQTDHFFAAPERGQLPAAMEPADSISLGRQANVILVAAAGGGIQAAGWTARVLTGLEEQIAGGRFGRAVRLVSGVSGGAVGAMYFANAFRTHQPPSPKDLCEARDAAMESSLDEVAWGLLNPDLQRAVFPFFRDPLMDRGWALEQAFQSRAGLGRVLLSEWEGRVRQGIQPPVIFSTTIVETGAPLVFSTTAYPQPGDPDEPSPVGFRDLFGRDIAVATAARLSAAFPIVSPAAHPLRDSASTRDRHLVDGGYYDNFGMTQLIGWLDQALDEGAAGNPVKRVLVLEILPFPPEPEDPAHTHGWAYQFQAPIDALLSVRTTAQHANNEEQLHLFRELWRKEPPSHRVEIDTLHLQFRSPDDKECKDNEPPLSWRLRSAQKRCIERAWKAMESQVVAQVNSFLNQP